jgi:GT2 family glycosyltransferase
LPLFISVVNHFHDALISNEETLKNLAKHHKVIVKSNTLPSTELKTYCKENNLSLMLPDDESKGFGANNNEVFNYAISQLRMQDNDFFLVLNPDVIITEESIEQLLLLATQFQSDISAINLYKNRERTLSDDSIRRYHSLLNPLKGLLGLKRNDAYDKSKIEKPITIDWAAGSFLLFTVKSYKKLKGFDEKYFMYFEDVDICTRANKQGLKVMYFPQIEAIHLAAHNNRKLFSNHFKWYLFSLIRYHFL